MRDTDKKLRDLILQEIQRVAEANDGKAPGRQIFERETGIKESAWLGIIWSKWGDAVTEAGYAQNALQARRADEEIFKKLVEAFRHFGRLPTDAELRLYRRNVDPTFPSHSSHSSKFGGKAFMLESFSKWLKVNKGHEDVLVFIPESTEKPQTRINLKKAEDGHVYLLRSGSHYKIGNSYEIEKRIKQIRVQMPDPLTEEHRIVTDDPYGIEAYWLKRFKDRRLNGEWFKLTPQDVLTFKRRKLM